MSATGYDLRPAPKSGAETTENRTMDLKLQLKIAAAVCLAALAVVLGASAEPTVDQGEAWLQGEFEGSREEVLALMAHLKVLFDEVFHLRF